MAKYVNCSVAVAKLTHLEVTEPNATIVDAKRVLEDMPREKVVSLHDIYRVIAGHSYYHGDRILSALSCIAEGKEVNPIQPTDLVFLRRCKDCRYFENATVNSKGFLICHITGMDITPEDYCSYSETKKDLKIKQMTVE